MPELAASQNRRLRIAGVPRWESPLLLNSVRPLSAIPEAETCVAQYSADPVAVALTSASCGKEDVDFHVDESARIRDRIENMEKAIEKNDAVRFNVGDLLLRSSWASSESGK